MAPRENFPMLLKHEIPQTEIVDVVGEYRHLVRRSRALGRREYCISSTPTNDHNYLVKVPIDFPTTPYFSFHDE